MCFLSLATKRVRAEGSISPLYRKETDPEVKLTPGFTQWPNWDWCLHPSGSNVCKVCGIPLSFLGYRWWLLHCGHWLVWFEWFKLSLANQEVGWIPPPLPRAETEIGLSFKSQESQCSERNWSIEWIVCWLISLFTFSQWTEKTKKES